MTDSKYIISIDEAKKSMMKIRNFSTERIKKYSSLHYSTDPLNITQRQKYCDTIEKFRDNLHHLERLNFYIE